MGEREFNHTGFQAFLDEGQLMGVRCQSCGALYLPPRPLCTNCYSQDLAWEALSGEGELRAFTTIHIAPTAMLAAGYGRDNPYCSGVVQLREGPSISAQILDVDVAHPENIAIGAPLKVDFVAHGEGENVHATLAFRA